MKTTIVAVAATALVMTRQSWLCLQTGMESLVPLDRLVREDRADIPAPKARRAHRDRRAFRARLVEHKDRLVQQDQLVQQD